MLHALPARVMDYEVTAGSPTAELVTLGQILSEAADYAGAILDREHLAFARRCTERLRKVVGELTARGSIRSQEDLYEIDKGCVETTDLGALTIDSLYRLYRQWPLRHEQRLKEGREHFTFYYEGRIVRELQRRRSATKGEQLMVDYCVAAYRNELENMAFTFSCPVKAGKEDALPDSDRTYTPAELAALIARYSRYRDVAGREILIEYVDLALGLLQGSDGNPELFRLLTEIAGLGQRNIIRVPRWVNICADRLQDRELTA